MKWPLPKAPTPSQTPCPVPRHQPVPSSSLSSWSQLSAPHLPCTQASSPLRTLPCPSSAWNAPLISRTGSCSPLRSQTKCHHFKRLFYTTWPTLFPAFSTARFCFASQNSVPCKHIPCASSPYLLPQLQYKIHEGEDLLFLVVLFGTACWWKKGRWERREGRRKGEGGGAENEVSASLWLLINFWNLCF